MEIVKIGLLGVAGVLLALQFKESKPVYGLYIAVAVCLFIFSCSLSGLTALPEKIKRLLSALEGSAEYLGFLFKAVGITYVCEFCASICKDAGYGAVAGQIETFGKLSILFMGIPVLSAVVQNINAIAG